MGFIDDIPNYRTLKNEDYYYTEIPNNLWDQFEGKILKHEDEDNSLKTILNQFATIIPTSAKIICRQKIDKLLSQSAIW